MVPSGRFAVTASWFCSVIVPSYRSEHTIRACLVSLLTQQTAPDYEIIVVDSSPDRTPAIVRNEFPQIKLIHLTQQTGPAEARNIGAEMAKGEVLAFIDSDCIAHPKWLADLVSLVKNGHPAVGGSVGNANPQSPVSWAGYFCEFRHFIPEGHLREVDNLTLGNAAYLSQSFWQAGGFPSDCFPQEDQVFHKAFHNAGFSILFDPQNMVMHHHRTGIRQFLEHQRSIGRANARVARRLNLPGSSLARRSWLAWLGLPGLAALRWARTVWAVRKAEAGLIFRSPLVAWLVWIGMFWWGIGFARGASDKTAVMEVGHACASD
jgi:glycosyltransferase involved in cell wall biosynthesis